MLVTACVQYRVEDHCVVDVDPRDGVKVATCDATVFRQRDITALALQDVARIDGSLAIHGHGVHDLGPLRSLTEISGDLDIWPTGSRRGPRLSDLRGLDQLTRVGGRITLRGLPRLATLDGLDALTEAGAITVQQVPALERIDALRRLEIVHDDLSIHAPALASVSALRGLTAFWSGGPPSTCHTADLVGQGLFAISSDTLTTLDGLQGLRHAQELSIHGDAITDVSALFALEQVAGIQLQTPSAPADAVQRILDHASCGELVDTGLD